MKQGENMCGLANSASYPSAKAMGPVPPSPPTPPAPTSTHYGDPAAGCMTDEVAIQIQGVNGDFCSPKCGLFKAQAPRRPAPS